LRVDLLLVQRGLAPSRSAAQRLIAAGGVQWLGAQGWVAPRKAGDELPSACELRLVNGAETRWVSRGGLKLEGALAHCGLPLQGWRVLDVGQSTGGFSEVCLAAGAAEVVGVDVGHGQLHPRLAAETRLRCIEGLNARDLTLAAVGGRRFDLCVADLSFISLTLVLPAADRAAEADRCACCCWSSRSSSCNPADIGKGGLVKDEACYPRVEARLRVCRRSRRACRVRRVLRKPHRRRRRQPRILSALPEMES
jgi:23S rRNA (cytidine1920-2'-O)/16S rRNA (cytidine1409-2'-O)-methyltransferase